MVLIQVYLNFTHTYTHTHTHTDPQTDRHTHIWLSRSLGTFGVLRYFDIDGVTKLSAHNILFHIKDKIACHFMVKITLMSAVSLHSKPEIIPSPLKRRNCVNNKPE